jgi:hypothetical protein
VEHANGGEDNFVPLASLDWQVHVYGEASKEMRAMCATRKLPLHVFPWRAEMRRTGLWRNAAYLVRPDGYVGLADAVGNPAAVISYLDSRGIRVRE